MSVENILAVYERANEWDIAEGLTWYAEAHRLCVIFSKRYDKPLDVVIAVMAALSPRNKWSQNVKDTERILQAVNDGEPEDFIKTGTTHLFRDRAYKIARTGNIGLLRGPKVWSFYKNIYDYDFTDRVTVDVWAARVVEGVFSGLVKLDNRIYNKIEREYQEAAKLLGLRPLELQAITWVTVRRYAKIKGHLNQLSFF